MDLIVRNNGYNGYHISKYFFSLKGHILRGDLGFPRDFQPFFLINKFIYFWGLVTRVRLVENVMNPKNHPQQIANCTQYIRIQVLLCLPDPKIVNNTTFLSLNHGKLLLTL